MPLLLLSKSNPLRWASIWFWVQTWKLRHLYCWDIPRRSKVRFAPTFFIAKFLSCAFHPKRTCLPDKFLRLVLHDPAKAEAGTDRNMAAALLIWQYWETIILSNLSITDDLITMGDPATFEMRLQRPGYAPESTQSNLPSWRQARR